MKLTDKEMLLFVIGTNEIRSYLYEQWLDYPEVDDIQSFAMPIIANYMIEGFWAILKIPTDDRSKALDNLSMELGLMLVCELLPE